MSIAKPDNPLSETVLEDIELGDDVYVGLFVCSHNEDEVEKAKFNNVRIVVPAPDDFKPYRDYFGSRLEIMNVATGHRRIVHETGDSMQAPNWTRDDQALIYNRNGNLFRFDIKSSSATEKSNQAKRQQFRELSDIVARFSESNAKKYSAILTPRIINPATLNGIAVKQKNALQQMQSVSRFWLSRTFTAFRRRVHPAKP